jgi:hypothetical protein
LVGNVDCGGGIAITGSNAFFAQVNTQPLNITNTFINFKSAGAAGDWCYLRQIGSNNAYKLAFDFHDDGDDARFCLRSINSFSNPDIITEVFTVDNGNVSCVGTLNVSGTTRLNSATTLLSSLNVSGTTTLNNATTLLSPYSVVGNIIGSGTYRFRNCTNKFKL